MPQAEHEATCRARFFRPQACDTHLAPLLLGLLHLRLAGAPHALATLKVCRVVLWAGGAMAAGMQTTDSATAHGSRDRHEMAHGRASPSGQELP